MPLNPAGTEERQSVSPPSLRVSVPSLYLLHLTGSVVVRCHAAALLFNLHGSGLEEAISDRPLAHITSAVAADLHLSQTMLKPF